MGLIFKLIASCAGLFLIPATAVPAELQEQQAANDAPVVQAPGASPALPQIPPGESAAESGAKINLSSASIYVYDFLDMREDVYSTKVLDEFERQLAAWLSTKARAVTILRSNQTPLMQQLKAEVASNWNSSISGSQISQSVPVMPAIASNHAAEKSFGADHRLIVFPASFTMEGVWRSYNIRWVAIRNNDGRLWEYLYSGRHMVMLKESERAESRSKKIINGVNQAMETAAMFEK